MTLLGPVVQSMVGLGATAIHIHTSAAGAMLAVTAPGWSFTLGLWPRRRIARFASPTNREDDIEVPLELKAIEEQARQLAEQPFPFTIGGDACI